MRQLRHAAARVSHYHVWKLQEPEPGEVRLPPGGRDLTCRGRRPAANGRPSMTSCGSATPRTDAPPHWAAFCRKLNERSTAPGTPPPPRPAAAPLSLSCTLSITPCTFPHYDEQSAGALLAPPLLRHPARTRRSAQTVHAGHIRTTPGRKDHHGAPGPGPPQKAPPLRHRRLPGAADLRLDLPTVEPGQGSLPGERRRRPRPGRDPEGRGLARGSETPVGRGHPERLRTARDPDGLIPPAGPQGTLREPGGPLPRC